MRIEVLRDALLWCAIINYAIVVVWFLLFLLAHAWLHRRWGRWFRMSGEQFDALNFGAMAFYKVGILLLNLVPYVALRIVG